MASILSRRKGFAEIPSHFACLPCDLWRDVFGDKEMIEKELHETALHESAHALIALLGGHPTAKLRISGTMISTKRRIMRVLDNAGAGGDWTSFLAQGEVQESSDFLQSGSDRDLSVLYFLGGLAATAESPIFAKDWGEQTKEWDHQTWTDITIPRSIVIKAIQEKGYQGTQEEAKMVLSSLFADMKEAFKSHDVVKALFSIKKTILAHRTLLGKQGQEFILEGLRNDNIDLSIFPEMLSALRSATNIERHIAHCLDNGSRIPSQG